MVTDRDLAWGSELTIQCKIMCSGIVHLKPVSFLLTSVAPIEFHKRQRKFLSLTTLSSPANLPKSSHPGSCVLPEMSVAAQRLQRELLACFYE